ncbi:helix-turn-helix transcriptional regulator [Streptomyces poonensis]|uniref:Transcriptional regulator n=1 Tax=Streptomyces poonensis TaxID=68255 RepID=A0A918UVA8_9ACTN|nr:helix-turn-helix domain-containing protein [Streptomyces poonensis]GGZ38115.1 transcriptional regulator [Streptomyces poonensis]GLJ91076.1 transcriptional regulator [Streptomyces poonensis]
MAGEAGGWTFLTNHARVLLAIARDPDVSLRQVAAACRISERTAGAIVADLERAGYLQRERVGRRNHYALHPDRPLRHPAEDHLPVRVLLECFAALEADPAPSPG